MLINKNTKAISIVSGLETENYAGVDWITVPKELEEKVTSNSPYFDFVLDEESNVIDIIPTERPKPELIVPEPTTEEMLLQAYLKISELENRLQALEVDK